MHPALEARYLEIEWQSEGVAREIEVAPVALELEPRADGGVVVETAIFHDLHPWLGLRLGPRLEEATPVFVSATGQETPMLPVTDSHGGGVWWVRVDDWDQAGKRHLSELHRSPGTYEVKIGKVTLKVDNRLSTFGRADIQAYVDDFRGDLLWMIMNTAAGATASGKGAGTGAELAEALGALHVAARKVLKAPGVTIREEQASQPIAKLRPNAASFRDYTRNPAARRLTGRVSVESADTAENRYVRHILAASRNVGEAFQSAASLRVAFLERLASEESERAQQNRMMKMRRVDPSVFDRQTEDRKRKLEALAAFKGPPLDEPAEIGRFPIHLGKQRRQPPCSFFYTRQDAIKDSLDYRVVVFPEEFFKLVKAAHKFCPDLTITGSADSCIPPPKNGKRYRKLTITSVQEVVPQTNEIEKRERKERSLEKNDWLVPLSPDERRELRLEAEAGARHAEHALKSKEAIAISVEQVGRWLPRLAEVDAGLKDLGVSRSPIFPTGMLFVSNPNYAACWSAFKKVCDLLKRGGLDLSQLEELGKVGILHVSNIYEKWCLLKLFDLLVHDFLFEPERRWEEKLVTTALAHARNVRFEFSRNDLQMKVVLTWQAELPTGRRPDFVLEVFHANEKGQCAGIVLDAKFKNNWEKNELRGVLDELILAKGYGATVESGRVFILQPREATALHETTSPLDWGAHCDYGGTDSHRRGWVQTGVTCAGTSSTRHLKRLLAMVFQSAFPEPQRETGIEGWTSRSFCLSCGERHVAAGIEAASTAGGRTRWRLCCKRCGLWTVRTHCYECEEPLFKNGTIWTYHTTLADQVTNVICPSCEAFFEAGSPAAGRASEEAP